MIFYFTGTGSSRYIAQRIAHTVKDEIVSINDIIKNGEIGDISGTEDLIFVTPTYAWRIPKLAEEWIEKTSFTNAKRAWFIMACGGEIGNAAKYIKRLCGKKGLEYMGVYPVVMPENYTALFYVPDKKESAEIIKKAAPEIDRAAQYLLNSEPFPPVRNNLYDKFMSGPVNPIFYTFMVSADKFYSTDKCVSCNKCVTVCPLNNIKLVNSRPEWGKNCTHCMACIAYCPAKAIEYGKKSAKRNRYTCPEFSKDNSK